MEKKAVIKTIKKKRYKIEANLVSIKSLNKA